MAHDDTLSAPVFSIQHFCLQDGPGIRSIVFFKGCPLRCAWCQNPESWNIEPDIGFKAHLCMDCGFCVSACAHGALARPGPADMAKCRHCFACVERCPTGARVRVGETMSVSTLFAALEPEFPLFAESGGGVTLSGGEPTLHAPLCGDLTGLLQAQGINVALSTCGQFTFPELNANEALARLLRDMDLILFDLKIWNPEKHRAYCGGGNRRIKENFVRLRKAFLLGAGPPVRPRLPLVPGITDTQENLKGWAGFLHEAGCHRLTLVPYHRLGEPKRTWLGIAPGIDITDITDAAQGKALDLLRREGIDTCAPGEEMWEAA